MNDYHFYYALQQYPVLHLLIQISLSASCAGVCLFGIIVLPITLNKRFDPIYGPKKGEQWEIGKNAAYPGYFVYRAHDYAKAILFEDFALKKYFTSSREFRAQVAGWVIPACWFYLCCWYVFGFVFLPLGFILMVCSWFL